MRLPTAVFSFRIKGNMQEVYRLSEKLKNIKFVYSFGGTKTILNYSLR